MTIQDALFTIYKDAIAKDNIKSMIKTIHREIIKLLGSEKASNFYIALHIQKDKYTIPYYKDEHDVDPVDTPISLKGSLTEYTRRVGKTIWINLDMEEKLKQDGLVEPIGHDSFDWIGSPLLTKKRFLGVMAVQIYDPSIRYSQADVNTIDSISKNIGIAIARVLESEELSRLKKSLEEEVSRKGKILIDTNRKLQREIAKVTKNEKIQKVLFKISELKNRTLSLKELIKRIHKELSVLIDVENFYVAIKHGMKKGEFQLPFMQDVNPEEQYQSDHIYHLSNSFTDYVFTQQKALMATEKEIIEIEKDSRYKMHGIKPKIWVGIPLKTKSNKILGVVTVQNYDHPKAYSKTDLKLLSLISTTIADAIEYRQLEGHKKVLEKRLVEAQKMETLGIFAAGISHEFNNLLSIIIGNAHIGMMSSKPHDRYHSRFKKIISSGENASDLIEKLMIFTNFKKKEGYTAYKIESLLNETVAEIRQQKSSRAEFNITVDENLKTTRVDRDDMITIFSNLFSNAIDSVASVKHGKIDVSIVNYYGNPKDLEGKKKRYICLSVTDNGSGIDDRILDKIFDPFFTTKDPGKGTGLGLSMVYAIIKEHEGEIKVETKCSRGTNIRIYLPAMKQSQQLKA